MNYLSNGFLFSFFSFIQHRNISLMKIDSKGIYNVTKDQIDQINATFLDSVHQRILKMYHGFLKNIKQHNYFQHWW